MAAIRTLGNRSGDDDEQPKRRAANPAARQARKPATPSGISGESDGLGGTGDYQEPVNPEDIPTRVKIPTTKEKIASLKKEKGSYTAAPAGLHDQLLEKMVEWSEWLPPTANRYGTYNADKAVKSAIELGNKYEPMMKALIRLANAGNTYYIAQFMVGLIYAIRMDIEGLDPDTKMSKWLGVQKAWDDTHDRILDHPAKKNANVVSESQRVKYEPPFKFIPVNPAWSQPGYNPYDPMGRYTG